MSKWSHGRPRSPGVYLYALPPHHTEKACIVVDAGGAEGLCIVSHGWGDAMLAVNRVAPDWLWYGPLPRCPEPTEAPLGEAGDNQ